MNAAILFDQTQPRLEILEILPEIAKFGTTLPAAHDFLVQNARPDLLIHHNPDQALRLIDFP